MPSGARLAVQLSVPLETETLPPGMPLEGDTDWTRTLMVTGWPTNAVVGLTPVTWVVVPAFAATWVKVEEVGTLKK